MILQTCLFVMGLKPPEDYESLRRRGAQTPLCQVRIVVSPQFLIDLTGASVIALSADAQESTKQFCLSAGMNLFLSKPLKKS